MIQKKTYPYFIFILFLILISPSCNRVKKMSTEERSSLNKSRDSLDVISRDTIAVRIGKSEKSFKMAWSRNTTNLQKEFIEELLHEFIFVEGGTFLMGCNKTSVSQCDEAESPVHQVTISSFHITKYEITQLLWLEIMGYNPNSQKNNKYPVTNVSWDECQDFIKRLNHITSLHFAIPTEAQWEFAARGGIKSKNTLFSGSEKIEEVAWYKENSNSFFHIIGTLKPNELGIYDMSGNVWEWCNDYYGPYSAETTKDPPGSISGINRVYRGGSWLDNKSYTRITNRNCGRSDYKMNCLGFRIVFIP